MGCSLPHSPLGTIASRSQQSDRLASLRIQRHRCAMPAWVGIRCAAICVPLEVRCKRMRQRPYDRKKRNTLRERERENLCLYLFKLRRLISSLFGGLCNTGLPTRFLRAVLKPSLESSPQEQFVNQPIVGPKDIYSSLRGSCYCRGGPVSGVPGALVLRVGRCDRLRVCHGED